MKIKFKNLFRENYYKTLSTIFLATGLSLSSYYGLYLKEGIFGGDISNINLKLCLSYLALGIIMLAAAVFLSLKIDDAKGVEKK